MIVKGGRAAPCMWEGGCGHAARVNFGAPPWGGPRWRAKIDECVLKIVVLEHFCVPQKAGFLWGNAEYAPPRAFSVGERV